MTASVLPRNPTIGTPEIRSTRLLFLIVGFGVAGWVALVPFVKARAGLGSAGRDAR